MAIYRGIGGAGDSNTDATVTAVTEQAVDAAQSATEAASSATQAANSAASASTSATNASSSATSSSTSATSSAASASAAATSASDAQTARNAAELAQTAAETAQTGAETAETNAGNSAIAADASANDAATSEANAAASETASAASASAASTSATAAVNSAIAASTSATAASTSATNAATSATNAATSETNAATSATSAATSATTATTKASEASTSSTNAATSETNALTSETNAASSATAAASSATSASTSAATATTKASEAATSATNAATSETNAAASETAAAASQTAAEAAKDAALEALDSFDDRYLGQKTSDPTVDNDGNALVAGALYFNTTDDVMKVYEGSTWVAAYASLSGALLANNNLSDVLNVTAARTNLGLGTAATTASTDYATAAQGVLADSAIQAADLGTAAYTASTDYATAAQGALADSALQSIPDNYVLNTGDSITGNLTFGDNDKAIFGAGSDLQIYHDGSNSYITNTQGSLIIRDSSSGSGDLSLQTNGSELSMFDSAGSKYMLRALTGGAVDLYHNGSGKLHTTSTGIDVTGTATMDGLTVDSTNIQLNGSNPYLDLNDTTNVNTFRIQNVDSTVRYFADKDNEFGNSKHEFWVDNKLVARLNNNGDISFYEDTGTTAKFFWDASAESLGIGTSSPAVALDVYPTVSSNTSALRGNNQLGSSGAYTTTVQSTNNWNYAPFVVERLASNTGTPRMISMQLDGDDPASTTIGGFNAIWGAYDSSPTTGSTSSALNGAMVYGAYSGHRWYNNGTERMRIDASGNVGIGTSSPTSFGAGSTMLTTAGTTGYGGYLASTNTVTGQLWAQEGGNVFVGSRTNTPVAFTTNNTERMRIDSSGNLLVGTTSTTPAVSNDSDGTALQANGTVQFSANATTTAIINRKATDGAILQFRKDGTTVGSIGSYNGFMYVGSPSGNDAYMLMGSDFIAPSTSTGTARDAAIDLGSSSRRFKDLYLSGTANVNTVDLGDWTITESAGVLYFATNGTNKMKLDASGNLSVAGDVSAYATI